MVLGLFSLLWLFSEAPKKVDPIPVDGLIEVVATVKESLTVEPEPTSKQSLQVQPVDPQPSPSDKPHEKTKREILIFVSKNCPPCEKWKRCEMQRFMNAGWAVGIVDQHSYGITPTFEIESGDKKATIKGYTTLEQAGEAVR